MFRIKARRKSSSVRKQPRIRLFSVGKFLQDARFPLSKKDLINIARKNKAPALVLSILRPFEDRRYITLWTFLKKYCAFGMIDYYRYYHSKAVYYE